MDKIEYSVCNETYLDIIGPLWEKIKEHHRVKSKYFSERYSQITFNDRKKVFLEKAKSGAVRIDLAKDLNRDKYVGYCVSSITGDNEGEIDSIYVEADYRRMGIGDCLMKKTLEWMDTLSVEIRKIVIAVGNEEAISFYERYGFFPLFTTVMQKSDR
ncbi:MAG: GNAT family N-acetyltransferase [Peptococcaceae bacterium]